ncbi:MAG: hypothetical protein EVA65_10870 [Oceanococcus sp.]|nr:MAG: hypothetical protein EVA65_10870 [Oceanococcus sp.]
MSERKRRPEAALHNQSGQTIKQGHSTAPLALAGWRFEPVPRRTVARLRHLDGSVTYFDAARLVEAPEYMARLSEADQNEVREMVLHRGAA